MEIKKHTTVMWRNVYGDYVDLTTHDGKAVLRVGDGGDGGDGGFPLIFEGPDFLDWFDDVVVPAARQLRPDAPDKASLQSELDAARAELTRHTVDAINGTPLQTTINELRAEVERLRARVRELEHEHTAAALLATLRAESDAAAARARRGGV